MNEQTQTIFVMGDNSGAERFFYDAENRVFSDSFLFLVRRRAEIEPCREAISNILCFAPELNDLTPVVGITSTSPDSYYAVSVDREPKQRSKLLWSIDSENCAVDMRGMLERMLAAVNGQRYAAACTGGVDSRTVLSAVMAAGGDPSLIVAGSTDSDDLRTAVDAANRLYRPITIVDTSDREENWLQKAFEFSDGCCDTVAAYQNMIKTHTEYNARITYEFGGYGGEIYRKQYFRRGRGVPSVQKLSKQMYDTSNIPQWLGEQLRPYAEKVYDRLNAALCRCTRSERTAAYLDAARIVYRSTAAANAFPISRGCTVISPLAEPRIIASACSYRPEALAMSVWQRERIAEYKPELSELATDTGHSCSVNEDKVKRERRMMRLKKTLHSMESETIEYGSDHSNALSSIELVDALEVCQNLGFVSSSLGTDELKIRDIGNILRIGMLFSEKYVRTARKENTV